MSYQGSHVVCYKSVFDGIQKAIAAHPYAWFADFFKNFYNPDQLLGTRIREQAIQAGLNVAAKSISSCQLSVRTDMVHRLPKRQGKVNVPRLVIQRDADRIVILSIRSSHR